MHRSPTSIDGGRLSNRSRGIKRCLIRIILVPTYEDVAVNYRGFKRNYVTRFNRDLFIVNSANTVIYCNCADRLDPDVLAFSVGAFRRSNDLSSIFRIVACVNGIVADEGGSRLESIIIPTGCAVRFNGTVFNVDSPIHLHGSVGLRVKHEIAGLRVHKVITIGTDGSIVCSCRQGNVSE